MIKTKLGYEIAKQNFRNLRNFALQISFLNNKKFFFFNIYIYIYIYIYKIIIIIIYII